LQTDPIGAFLDEVCEAERLIWASDIEKLAEVFDNELPGHEDAALVAQVLRTVVKKMRDYKPPVWESDNETGHTERGTNFSNPLAIGVSTAEQPPNKPSLNSTTPTESAPGNAGSEMRAGGCQPTVERQNKV
jgi:hypothetical protein